MGLTRSRPWWMASAATVALIAATLVGPMSTTASATAAAGPPVPSMPEQQGTQQALAQARASGKPMVVAAATTSTDMVTANPNGSLTLERLLVPARKKVEGQWRALDPTLHRGTSGSIRPAVTTGELALSGGGSGSMIAMSTGAGSLALQAPMELPTPTLDGPTATYPGVLPGVDLVVTAGRQGGSSHVFVVHDARAAANPALRSLAFATATRGLTVSADAAGNLTAADRFGRPVFAAPTPYAWDSTTDAADAAVARELSAAQRVTAGAGQALVSSIKGPGRAARRARVGVTVRRDAIVLTPPRGMLTDPRTVYPLFIDPVWNLASLGPKRSGYASVPAAYPTSNKWNSTGDPDDNIMQVGNADGWRARTMINYPIDVTRLKTATIHSAVLDVTNVYSYSCTDKPTNIYAPATKLTSSNATWDYWSDVSLGSAVQSLSFAHGYNSGCPARGVGFNVLTGVRNAVTAGRSTQTFVLKSANEGDSENYKEFSLRTFKLSITYNRAPNVPGGSSTSPATSCTASPPDIVGDGPVSLYARVSDPDGMIVGVRFSLWRTAAPGTSLASSDPNVLTYASGGTAVLVVPRNTLLNAAGGAITQFSWKVQTWDGYATSAWSTTCSFRFDPTRTGPPTIDSPPSMRIGDDATFTITKPATGTTPTGFLYQLNGAAPDTVTADASGNATITITPTRFTNTLTVTSRSAGGNIGDTASVTFNATPAATAADGDLTGDDAADLVTVGGANGLPAGLWLAAGKGTGDVSTTATNIGAYGNGVMGTNGPGDFTGAQAITGHFTGTGLQDALVYYPTGADAGHAVILNGNGDGSPIAATLDENHHDLPAGTFTDETGGNPIQLVNAGNTGGRGLAYPDLIGVAGGDGGSYLAYYPNMDFTGGYGQADILTTPTPSGGTDWNTWTITSAQVATGTAIFLWQPATGALHLWTNLAYDLAGTLTYTAYQLSTSWNTGAPLTLHASDVNHDDTPDLWGVGGSSLLTAHTVADLPAAGGTGTITPAPAQTLVTSRHAWLLNDASDGPVTTAQDIAGTLDLTAAGNATWNTGDLFSPDIRLDGTNSTLAASSAALATNAEFTVSAWVKPAAAGGTVLSQDGVNTTGFKIWAEASDHSWRFAMTRTDVAAPTWDTAFGPAGGVKLGVWTYLTATYKPSTGYMTLYVNGSNAATATHTTRWNATGRFRVGAHKTGASGYGGYLNGQVGPVQVWHTDIVPPTRVQHDLNADGRPDLVAVDNTGKMWLYPNHGSGTATFGPRVQIGSGWSTYRFVVADWDDDGRADILGFDSTGKMWLYPNKGGSGPITWGARVQVGSGWQDYTPAAGKVDANDHADVFGIKNSTGQLYYYPDSASKILVGTSGWTGNRIYAVDYDSDGRGDIVAINTTGAMKLYVNSGGGGTSMFPTTSHLSSGWSTFKAAPGDFTVDGQPDFVGFSTDGILYLYPNSIDSPPTRQQIGSGWVSAGITAIG